MLKIKVSFPEKGNPTVASDLEAAIVGRPLVWDVTSFNTKVKTCRIQFADKSIDYFGLEENTDTLDKPIKYGPDGTGSVQIEALAPAITSEDQLRRRDKYTVFGLDGAGNTICENDPEIIVIRPGG
jgi:hypothetical protein